jgi:hypothetical protein
LNLRRLSFPLFAPLVSAALFVTWTAAAQSRLSQLHGEPRTHVIATMLSDGGTDAALLRVANIGTGNAPTESRGPTTQPRGVTDHHPEEIQGPISEADAARVIRSKMPQLQPCYTQALAANRRLGPVRVSVQLTIERDGHLRPPSLQSTPANPAMLTCLTGAFSSMTFPRPATAPLILRYPLMFAPPVAPSAAPPARPRR